MNPTVRASFTIDRNPCIRGFAAEGERFALLDFMTHSAMAIPLVPSTPSHSANFFSEWSYATRVVGLRLSSYRTPSACG